MKDRILRFLQNENKSYAQFAEEIGVQPSGISHILSGRNNPSLDFILKMLSKYPALSAEWILFGRGSMYKTIVQPTLFDDPDATDSNISVPVEDTVQISDSGEVEKIVPESETKKEVTEVPFSAGQTNPAKILERVLFFYSDKTFTEYRP
ncbi:MAG TPA: helix-turn-helix transcriptional regulator [Bacteroidales bacterium]|nr:helix-turn-helix transcriptional regulator [Bacteroidales bacterium]